MSLKPPTTTPEQIQLLKDRGVAFANEEFANLFLSNVNYYTLTGYLLPYKNEEGGYANIDFDTLYKQYIFDSQLRNIVLGGIEVAELSLKTKISNYIAHNFENVTLHYDRNNENAYFTGEKFYVDRGKQAKLEGQLYLAVRNNASLKQVSHHIHKYKGNFPIWVIIELFTLGNIRHLFDNLPEESQHGIAKLYGVYNWQLTSWIENLRKTRNSLAHASRVYGVKYGYAPKRHPKNPVWQSQYNVFDQIMLLRWFYYDLKSWNTFLNSIHSLIEDFDRIIDLTILGFPDNWYELLKNKVRR